MNHYSLQIDSITDAEYDELCREQTGGARMLVTVMVAAVLVMAVIAAWSAA